MILELAGDRAFNRPVAGIVNPRGHFIREEAAILLKEFDREDADVLQRFEDTPGGVFGGALNGGI